MRCDMSKAVVVVDIPHKCCDCMFALELEESGNMYCLLDVGNGEPFYCLTRQELYEKKPMGCPLKPLPDKMDITGRYPQGVYNEITPSYKIGYNKCIDDIMGGITNDK